MEEKKKISYEYIQKILKSKELMNVLGGSTPAGYYICIDEDGGHHGIAHMPDDGDVCDGYVCCKNVLDIVVCGTC